MISVLVCGPYRNCGYSINQHLKSIIKNECQCVYLEEGKIDFNHFFITHNNDDLTQVGLEAFIDDYKGEVVNMDSDIRMKSENHEWTTEQVLYLSQLRDKCLAKGKDYDYVFMVDSDVILDSRTLSRLIELSEGEHVVHTVVLHTHDRWDKTKFCLYTNYQYKMAKNDTDLYTGKHLTLDEITRDFREAKPKEVNVAYMSWCIPRKVLDKVSFYEDGVYEFDFKVFSKKCRDHGIKQIVDFKYPATHLEKSGFVVRYMDEL